MPHWFRLCHINKSIYCIFHISATRRGNDVISSRDNAWVLTSQRKKEALQEKRNITIACHLQFFLYSTNSLMQTQPSVSSIFPLCYIKCPTFVQSPASPPSPTCFYLPPPLPPHLRCCCRRLLLLLLLVVLGGSSVLLLLKLFCQL